MNHLQNNFQVSLDDPGDEKTNNSDKQISKESSNLITKNHENRQSDTSSKLNTNGKQPKDDEDLIEQDLSDVEDNYEEPSVQRYMPGISVDLKLKTGSMQKNGNKIAIPMIVDFYSECLKKYGDEKNFIYEESYLENMRVKDEDLYPELYKLPKLPADFTGEFPPQISLDNKQILNVPESQKTGQIEENLDDVIWLKNRPNDPLLRCIRSITDRLNIQGIVGDPISYLKKGGDDMHYDMDDPFFDDSAMLSELKMSKSDILLQRAMEREFSDWSEDEEDLDYTVCEPEDFVCDYFTEVEKEIKRKDKTEGEYKLFFEPAGWREYYSKIPRQFIPIFNEFEASTKKITEPITDTLLRLKIKELLESIFKRLNKIQELNRSSSKKKAKKPKPTEPASDNLEPKEEAQEEPEPEPEPKPAEPEAVKEEPEKPASRPKTVTHDFSHENFKKRGLNCILPFRIIDINGKILRWIVKSINAITNSCSPYEIHCEWFSIVISNNERLVNEYSNKLRAKLTAKLAALKPKRLELMLAIISESTKSLSKSLGILKKLLKEHRELNGPKHSKSAPKDGSFAAQKMSLIEISLDSTRDDHDDFMGLDPAIINSEAKDPAIPSSEQKLEGTSSPEAKDESALNSDSGESQIGKPDRVSVTPPSLLDHSLPEKALHSAEYSDGFENPSKDNYLDEDKDDSDSILLDHNLKDTDNQGSDKTETSSNSSNFEIEMGNTQQTQMGESPLNNEENGYLNDKNEEFDVSEDNSESAEPKENGDEDKAQPEVSTDQNSKPSKKPAPPKDEDLESLLKQSKIMNRVKDVYKIFRLAGSEVISFIQISNLAISVAIKIQNKQFKHVIEHMGLTQNPFDQSYKRLGELVSKLLQETYDLKISLFADVVKVVVIKLQYQLKVSELYEKKNKKPLLLFDNSHTKASPGVVVLEQPKPRSSKKIVPVEGPEPPKLPTSENTVKVKEMKGSPRRKHALQQAHSKPQLTKTIDSLSQEALESVKRRKRAPTPSRVNSLKELLLSRLRN